MVEVVKALVASVAIRAASLFWNKAKVKSAAFVILWQKVQIESLGNRGENRLLFKFRILLTDGNQRWALGWVFSGFFDPGFWAGF